MTTPELEAYFELKSLHGTWNEGTLILMYHAIEALPRETFWKQLYVDPAWLRIQVSELQATGAKFIRTDDMIAGTTRERQVLITLDDGFRNVFENALPIFRELKVTALNYIVAGELGGSNTWDHAKGILKRPLMSREEIREWVAAGMEIGAHTMTHPHLTELTPAQARTEIFDCKKVLEDLIGRPVHHFCYPYGDMNAAIRDLVIEAGYKTATSCERGYNFPDTDKFTLRRLMAHD